MRRPKACPFRRGDGSYWARVRYVDESGKTRDRVERAGSWADAHARSIALAEEYGGPEAPPKPIIFNQLADLFTPHIEGQRSYKTTLGFLQTLRGHFGNKQLSSITYKDIQAYYKKRLRSESGRTGKRLKRASVNREVALLRRMFKEAIEQGFATKNPYKDGPPLIKPEQETRRNRELTKEEEERLLAVCAGRRAHLRPVILAALVTGATKSQLLRLTWGDVHIGLRTIRLRLPGERIGNARMSEELANALARLREGLLNEYDSNPNLALNKDVPRFEEWVKPLRIFRDFKTSFSSACRAARIKDLRFNDLRYTYKIRSEAGRERRKRIMATIQERLQNPSD
jgi:hypothetical protein